MAVTNLSNTIELDALRIIGSEAYKKRLKENWDVLKKNLPTNKDKLLISHFLYLRDAIAHFGVINPLSNKVRTNSDVLKFIARFLKPDLIYKNASLFHEAKKILQSAYIATRIKGKK